MQLWINDRKKKKFGCLIPYLTIFLRYCEGQCIKQKYNDNIINLSQATEKFDHKVVSSTPYLRHEWNSQLLYNWHWLKIVLNVGGKKFWFIGV